MLQFDRHFANGSKLIRGGHSKPPTDFVSRNKRAIRDKSRSQATRNAAQSTTTTTNQSGRANGRPRSRKALAERQQAERKREAREAGGDGRKRAGDGVSSDTVVISKSYLDELLRMSVVIRDEARDKKTNVDQNIPRERNESSRERSGRHVDIDSSAVPGLGNASATKHISATSSRPTEHAQNSATTHQQANYQGHTPHAPPQAQHSEHQATNNYQGLSPREKWLKDLAAQVEEQKAKKERKRLQEQQSTVEEYFPFGRPGGGAPIRSQSGALLTDYRSRTRVHDQGGVAMRDLPETKRVEDFQSQANFGAKYEASNRDGGFVAGHSAVDAYYGSISSGGGGDVMMMSPRRRETEPQQHGDVYNTTPRFARGAGPHVDQYMRREMDEKRRKQMEHMEFVRQQVAEKERVKLEEKLCKEREDAIEEARLARERERMKADFEREKEKARRKEVEARQRQALLQQRILEAEESARLAKLEARGVLVNTANHHHHPTVSFDEYAIVARSTEENLLGGEGVYSSLLKSDIRSPSMLQMAATTTNETGHHGDGNAPPTQRGGANGVRRGRVIGKSKATEVEDQRQVKRGNSRIPVVRKAAATKSKPRGAVRSEVQGSKVNGSVRGIGKASTRRGREGVARPPVNGAAALKTAVIGRTVTERSYSPPVPALAKKMKYQPQSFPEKDTLPHTQRNIEEDFIRSSSPPVPAVAKKLRNGQFESEDLITEYTRVPVSPPIPGPALTNTIRNLSNVGLVHNTVTQPLYERTNSPPVPAVAKRLRDEVAIASGRDHSVNEDVKRERSYDRALSPPLPTVAKKLQQGEPSKLKIAAPGKSQSGTNAPTAYNGNSKPIEKLNSDPKIDCSPSHMILADGSEISINRPPSCKPDSKPLSPVATTTTNLPSVPMATATRHRDNQRGVVHPLQASNRQRLILQQLTMLKEGILTQQNDIDHRVEHILTRNRQCNF